MITAKVIADSISELGIRITTLQLRFPRIILAEVNTHGALAKNARSTRAVPTNKLIREVREDPFIPIKWGSNNPGMQSNSEITDKDLIAELKHEWKEAARFAANQADSLFKMGLHKQWAGRLLEPFMWVDSVVTATDWANFDGLRNHPDAQPEFEALAIAIAEARTNSTPKLLKHGEWHMPYVRDEDYNQVLYYLADKQLNETGIIGDIDDNWRLNPNVVETLLKLSVARCARVSYAPFDGNGSIQKEVERYDLLVTSKPVHASPTEHQATPDTKTGPDEIEPRPRWNHGWQHGRFYGWRQYRKMIPGNTILDNHHGR